ncbi:MAG: hypothetical protein FJ399_07110 [Verrucomicrobia bacterium]|nr:hypothetical protein [Verrucomicrobiota bacterium]
MPRLTRRRFSQLSSLAGLAALSRVLAPRVSAGAPAAAASLEDRIARAGSAAATLAALREGWADPAATYRPHTRWWWPGNAVTREGLDWQLAQMKAQGFGGVEIMSWMKVYTRGNVEFESPEFIAKVRHVVDRSRELGLEVSLSLGPGWGLGNANIPEQHRSKVLVFGTQPAEGGRAIECALEPPSEPNYVPRNAKKFEAVVAVALGPDGKPDPKRRLDLTALAKGGRTFEVKPTCRLRAELPAGRWQLMTFWTAFTGQKCTLENYEPRSWIVDHLSRDAMRDFVTRAGDRYRRAFGADFGRTVDSFFGDSYEVTQDFSFWTDGAFDRFQKEKGYDLRPYLPLLIHDGAPETPYIRHDFGHFLHILGMEAAIGEMTDYCESAGIHMRQQPHYRFTVELIEASGRLQRPETEFCRRSFDPNAYPHKLTTSGAWLYPAKHRRWVSCEAFTFINVRYRTTMEEIKRATDLFLRDGITQFYNHGYYCSPERELEPARDLIYMNTISHQNTWWKHYRGLADYQARAAYLNRQGRAAAQVLVYSPMPTLWSERAEYPCKHVRDLPFGKLPKILVANGYDFDCVNDDLLLRHAQIGDGKITINGHTYSVLLLPRVLTLSPDTLRVVERFVRGGGTAFALSTLPDRSPGMRQRETRDRELRSLRDSLFAAAGGAKQTGRGTAFFLPACDGFEYLTSWSPGSVEWEPTAPLNAAWAEFIRLLRRHAVPDFEIAGRPQSDGLTFRRSRIGPVDCWFLCNLQPQRHEGDVTLNTAHRAPQTWDALTGEIRSLPGSRPAPDGRLVLPLALEPWASVFVLLSPPKEAPKDSAATPASKPGRKSSRPVPVSGPWRITFEGLGGVRAAHEWSALRDWRDVESLRNFSGSAVYRTTFNFTPAAGAAAVVLDLGAVHDVAAVRLNGVAVGTVWMQPYRLDVTSTLRAGRNDLEIEVTNGLWNHAAGLDKPSPIPAELHAHYGSIWNSAYRAWDTWQNAKSLKKNDRLPSGLLGPVVLRTDAG